MTRGQLVNAMTVDVEDYFHVTAFAGSLERERWSSQESRVERNTHVLLELFERHRVRTTFFVLGWVAERNPGLIKELHRAVNPIETSFAEAVHPISGGIAPGMAPIAVDADVRVLSGVYKSTYPMITVRPRNAVNGLTRK